MVAEIFTDPSGSLPTDAFNRNKQSGILILQRELTLRAELPRDPMINRGILTAKAAHLGKRRKVSGDPYILHSFATASLVSKVTRDPDVLTAAILHDVVEDSEKDPEGNRIFSLETIEEGFNPKIAYFVDHLTADEIVENYIPRTPDEVYWIWRNTKQSALNKALESPETIIIKTADLTSNVTDFLTDRDIIDEDGRKLADRVFDNFSVGKHSNIARFTHASIDLAQAYRDWKSAENPLAFALMEKIIELINASSQTDEGGRFYPLYEDWIQDLLREMKMISGEHPDK